jgi:hypothetical protein
VPVAAPVVQAEEPAAEVASEVLAVAPVEQAAARVVAEPVVVRAAASGPAAVQALSAVEPAVRESWSVAGLRAPPEALARLGP